MKLQLSFFAFAFAFTTWAGAQELISLPAKDDRVGLFQTIVDEMVRLDGEDFRCAQIVQNLGTSQRLN